MNRMKSFSEIHIHRQGKVSDKWDLYLDVYNDSLEGFRDKKINFLEIGVQNGGSLETWAEFFKNALKLVGCDIDHKCSSLVFEDPRIHIVVGDATKVETAEQIGLIVPNLDVVIEDGSHTSRDIVRSFVEYFPRIAPGGIYIAEDLHCCYWSEFGGGLGNPRSGMEFFKALSDCLNSNHWLREDITQSTYASNYGEMHNAKISDEILDTITAIEFYDSMCIIRKAKNAQTGRIRNRVISGTLEKVALGHLELEEGLASLKASQQPKSNWHNLKTLIDDNKRLERENKRISEEIEELANALVSVKSSTSWMITSPLRKVADKLKILLNPRFKDETY